MRALWTNAAEDELRQHRCENANDECSTAGLEELSRTIVLFRLDGWCGSIFQRLTLGW